MDSRLAIVGIAVVVIIAAFFLMQSSEPTPQPPVPELVCGDDICMPIERNTGSCPEDCDEKTQPPDQQPDTEPANDCIPQCIQAGGKPQECILQCEGSGPSPGPVTDPDCGDGICQPREELQGTCSEDCDSSTANGLQLIKEIELDSGETRRPLVAVTNDRVFVIYGKYDGSFWDFKLKIFDKSLENILVSKTIIEGENSPYGNPMDVRIAAQGGYIYVFQDSESGLTHNLVGYKFTLDDAFEKVASLDTPLASGIKIEQAPSGTEVVDDPIVLATEDSIFVVTRYKGTISKSSETKYKVYELTHSLEKIREFDLDLSSALDGGARQASIRYYNGYYYLGTSTLVNDTLTGAQAGVDILSATDVVIVKLNTDWEIVDSHTIAGEIEDDAENYLTAFDLDEDHYYLAHKHATFESGTKFDTPLKVYDKEYNLVASVVDEGNGRPQLVLADGLIYYALGIQGSHGGGPGSTPSLPPKLYVYELTK